MQNEEIILRQFPKTAMIPLVTAGSCIGYAKQTCYNLANRNMFPIPVRKVGSKSMVALADLIAFLDEGTKAFEERPGEGKKAKAPKRRPGRPTKEEQVRRMMGEA